MRGLALSLLIVFALVPALPPPTVAAHEGARQVSLLTDAPVEPAPPIDLQQYNPFRPQADGTPTTLKDLILKEIPNFLLFFVGLVFIVFFLISAFRYLVSAGNTESTGEAKHGMLSAIIGIIVVVTAYAVIAMANQWIGD